MCGSAISNFLPSMQVSCKSHIASVILNIVMSYQRTAYASDGLWSLYHLYISYLYHYVNFWRTHLKIYPTYFLLPLPSCMPANAVHVCICPPLHVGVPHSLSHTLTHTLTHTHIHTHTHIALLVLSWSKTTLYPWREFQKWVFIWYWTSAARRGTWDQ